MPFIVGTTPETIATMVSAAVIESPRVGQNLRLQIQQTPVQESPIENGFHDEESDYEFGLEAPPPKREAFKGYDQIIQGIDGGSPKFSLETKDDRKNFVRLHGKYCTAAPTRTTLLHKLVKTYDPAVFQKRKPLIEFLLKLDSGLLKSKDEDGKTPFLLAVSEGDVDIVRCLCESTKNKKIVREAISIRAKKRNCLHVAIGEEEAEREMLDYLLEIIGEDTKVFTQTDEDGNTPLHLAVDYGRCNPPQSQLVSKLVEKSKEALGMANNEELEPLRYHILTRQSAIAEAKSSTVDSSRQKDEQGRSDRLGKDLALKRVNTDNTKRDDTDIRLDFVYFH